MKRVWLVCMVLLSAPAVAQVPAFVTYSGRLTDGTGWGQSAWMDLTVTLYDAPEGGAVVFRGLHKQVPVVDGYFTVNIGMCDQAGLCTDDPGKSLFPVSLPGQAWLGVAVGAGPDMVPRQPVGSVPYAIAARSVVGGAVVSGDLTVQKDLVVQGNLTVTGRLVVGGRLVGSCPSDMVQVGDICVDRYEASVWERKDGKAVDCEALQKAVDEAIAAGWSESEVYNGNKATCGTSPIAMCQYRQYGSPPGCNSENECDDYPAAFPDSGNWTKPLYACAVKGVMPSRSLTWFQAQQACVNAGKHLITNGEWQAAVAGTPDTTACNTATSGSWKTGHGTCKSATGVEDLIGNLWEWADLWGQAGPASGSYSAGTKATPWPASYGDGADGTWNVNGQAYSNGTGGWTTGLAFAARRGGDWDNGPEAGAFAFHAHDGPSHWSWSLGLRCARGGR